MTCLCNLDGEILPEDQARVPVLDRGFLFGDSVYEVIATRDGVPFAWPEHLDRPRRSAEGLGMALDLDDREVMRRIRDTVAQADHGESYIRIIVTRGTGTAPNIALDCAPGPLRWVILVRPRPELADSVDLALVPRLRNDRRALDPAIKSGNYLNNVLGLAEAKAKGATDCLFLNAAGHVTEASTANVFVVKDGVLRTPPLNAGLLRGITRTLVLDCCAGAGLPVEEVDLSEADVRGADELMLTGTLKDIAPVRSLDGRTIGDGGPGPVTRKLMAAFEAFADRHRREIDAPALAAFDETP